MVAKGHDLLTLAAEQFPHLTNAERQFLHDVLAGEVAEYPRPNSAENNLRQAEPWDESRTVHAQVIRWVCINRQAIRQVDPKGIRIDGARIAGQLDLEGVTIPFPLFVTHCIIPDGVVLESAKTRSMILTGRALSRADHAGKVALRADGVHVRYLGQPGRAHDNRHGPRDLA
jgi:hypothetical protein